MHVQRMQQLLSPRHDNEAGLCVIQEVVVCAMEAIPKMLRLRVSALEDGRHFLKQIRHLNATTAWDAQHTHVTHAHTHTHDMNTTHVTLTNYNLLVCTAGRGRPEL